MKKRGILGNNLGMKFLLVNAILLAVIKAGTFMTGLELANFIDDLPAVSATEVVTATNALRQANELPVLRENIILDTVATQKLNDMIANQYFNHISPLGVNPWYWFDVNQYRYSYAGENLALGFMDAQSAVKAWNNSPSHRANLLNSNYEDILSFSFSERWLRLSLRACPDFISLSRELPKCGHPSYRPNRHSRQLQFDPR